MDKNVSSTIDKVDVALSSVTELIDLHRANKLDKKRVNDLLADLVQHMPEVEGIRLATKEGLVILGNGVTNAVSVADRDYFIYHRDNADDKLRISKPFVGRVAKHYILVFSRRYNEPDGRFAGVIFATISLDYFNKLLSQFDLGLDGTVVLRDSDLGLLARQPEISNKQVGIVGNREVSKEFRQLTESDLRLSTFHTKISADGMERTFSFRRLENAPFIVLVGMSSKEYLAGWYNEVYQMFAINLVILLLTMLSGYTLLKSFNALKTGSDRLLQQRQFSEDIINSLPGVFYMLDQHGHFIRVNPQFYEVTGYSNEEIKSLNAFDLFEGTDKNLIAQKMQEVFERGDSSVEADIVTKSGNKIPYYLTGHRSNFDDRTFLVGIGSDNTERKENELVQKTNRLILNNTYEGFWRFNIDGYLLEVNQAYADLMGYTQEELVGKHISDLSAYTSSPEAVRVRLEGIITRNGSRGPLQPTSPSAISPCASRFLKPVRMSS